MITSEFVLAMLLGAALLVVGLLAGYWRGRRRRPLAAGSDSLDTLAHVGQSILKAQLNLDALCEIVYQQSTRIVDTSNFQIGLFDGDDYIIKVWLQEAERQPPQRFTNGATEGQIGWVKTEGTGLLIKDYQKDWQELPAKPSYYDPQNIKRSAIFAPLVAGGESIGVIAVQSPVANAFNAEDLRRLSLLANLAAGAIRNAQLYEEARDRATYLRLIADVSRQITAIQPQKSLFEQIVHLVSETFDYYAVNIFTIDKATNEIILGASSAAELGFRDVRLPMGKGIVGWVAHHAETTLVPDVSTDDRYLLSGALAATKSELAVPLIFEETVLGVLDVQSNELDAFDKGDVFTLESLARQLALSIKEAQTYMAERRQSERLTALTEAARAVVSILDISTLLDKVVDLLDDHFGYDRVHFFLRSGNNIIFRAGSGVHSEKWMKEGLSYTLDSKGFIANVARSGEPIICNDVSTDDRYLLGPGLEDTQSEMTVPLQIGKNILGVFDIQSTKPETFSSEDLSLVQALADTVAIALRNASLFANETRRRILAETLSKVSTVLASSLDLESVLNGILLGLERVVEYTAAVILLQSEEDLHYRVSAIHGIVAGTEGIWERQIPPDADLEKALEDILSDLAGEKGEVQEAAASRNNHDILFVPLNINEQSSGYLAIRRMGKHHFTSEDQEIVTTFANQATVAIRNAQLYMQQKEEAWISNALLQVAEATGQSTNLEEVLHTVAHITPLLTGVEWCAILLAEDNVFRVTEVSGISQEVSMAFIGFAVHPEDWPPLQELIITATPIILDGATERPPSMPQPIEVAQAVLLPLLTKGEVTGCMLIGQSSDDEPLTSRKVQLVSGIANQAAMAIEGTQAYMAQQEEQWVTTVLLQVAEAVNGLYDLDETLEAITRLMKMLVGLNWCLILRWDPKEEVFFGAKSSGFSPSIETELSRQTIRASEDFFYEKLINTTGSIYAGEDYALDIPDNLTQHVEVPSILGLPLIAQGNLVGAMLVDDPGLVGHSGQRRLDILTGIAYQAALAIRNAGLQDEATAAQRLEREMEVARDIQLSLLPERPPEIPGWELAAYYRPARLVGGDFYDFIPLPDGKYALIIADVADKGTPAALFMATCRTLIRAVAPSGRGAAGSLERVNQLLMYDNRSDLFFTCWYAIFDPATGNLDYCSGGHNPPILIHADGKITELRSKGIAIGVLDEIKLAEDSVRLQPGDVLLAYTDGLTEAPRADMTEFGEVELHVTAMKYHKLSAIEMTKKIVAAVDRFTDGQPAFDDLTMFTVKCVQDK